MKPPRNHHETIENSLKTTKNQQKPASRVRFLASLSMAEKKIARCEEQTKHECWGLWEDAEDLATPHHVRLCVAGEEVKSSFKKREGALEFQLQQLHARFSWPREALQPVPAERSPIWDHPEELEALKQYTFREVSRGPGKALDVSQLEAYREDGFLLNLPVLSGEALATAREDFNQLVLERTDRAPDEDAKFRAAHTLARPLHQDLVQRLATHERVLQIVEAWRGMGYRGVAVARPADDPMEFVKESARILEDIGILLGNRGKKKGSQDLHAGGDLFDLFTMQEPPDLFSMILSDPSHLDKLLENLTVNKPKKIAQQIRKHKNRCQISSEYETGFVFDIDFQRNASQGLRSIPLKINE
eukprot:s26_g42.t1